ncbi:MAG: hypothetical protein LC106_00525 [Burkholderiales bacterium]|nr:hypothetical protein [Burkholderiales bacterium]
MQVFRSLSLRFQMLLMLVGVVVAGLGLTLAVLMQQTAQLEETAALQYAQTLAERNGDAAAQGLRQAFTTAQTLASALQSLQQAGIEGAEKRSLGMAMLGAVLAQNPQLNGVWTGWEPDAFDHADAAFANTAHHDGTGRFVPYFSRNGANGSITQDVLADYEQAGTGDYYLQARSRRASTLVEPYVYEFQGRQLMMTSLAVPIVQDGQFLGVAGTDLSLTDLQQQVQAIRLYDSGLPAFSRRPAPMWATAMLIGLAKRPMPLPWVWARQSLPPSSRPLRRASPT